MDISYKWLQDWIDIGLPVEETAKLLTGSGLEVEGITSYESLKGGLEGIVIGEVKTRIKHPNADKLSVTTVNVGGPEDLQIVCGAPNVQAGQKVLVALVGTTVHPVKGEPFKINKSKIRGEVSEGMICAEDEVGLGSSHDGILVLPAHYETGRKAIEYFPVYTDHVISIGLTANRGDAASHLGVARDLKALTGTALKPVPNEIPAPKEPGSQIQVAIEDNNGCIRYSGISMRNVKVGESPEWLQHRLKSIGLTPVNNVVDITNFVLHSVGQPLHAFDANRIGGGKIVVRQAPAGSKFKTLDQAERTLNGTECMICDAEKPLAIGGIFGGLDSGIQPGTTDIFIESATFNPSSIRKSAKHHGLSTDASFRFERGTDPNMTLPALALAVKLVLEIAGGEVSSALVDVYPKTVEPATVTFPLPRFRKLIGQDIPGDDIRSILRNLDMETVSDEDDVLVLKVPTYRTEVTREADVAEDVLRIYGLNRIEIPAQVRTSLVFSEDDKKYDLRNRICDLLSDQGFLELVNNSLTKSAWYTEGELKQAVRILNPLSTDLDIMRINMLYSGLETIQYNVNRRNTDLRLFEFGYTYRQNGKAYVETPHLALFLTGRKAPAGWKSKEEASDYFTLKRFVEQVLSRAGVSGYETAGGQSEGLEAASVVTLGKTVLCEYGIVNAKLLKRFDLQAPVMYADLRWKDVMEAAGTRRRTIKPVPAFPSVRRDLALVLDKAVSYAEIRKIARKAGAPLLRDMQVFDVYEGDKLEPGKKSYAVSFTLQDEEKTLTDKEIDAAMTSLVEAFGKQLGAKLRT